MVLQPVKPKPVKAKQPRNAGGMFHHFSDDEEEDENIEVLPVGGESPPVILEVA